MKKPREPSISLADIREALVERLDAGSTLNDRNRRRLQLELTQLLGELEHALGELDPVSHPTSVFDPSNPKLVSRFTALALVAQSRINMTALGRFYGSGVYAIYYVGSNPLYAEVSGTETPLYVGQAAPALNSARTPREQGERLAARLHEHKKNIERVGSLEVADFEVRFLVVQSGWETAAEDFLINYFRPVWNSEVGLVYGLGKHGDAAETRANKRSPWDTAHPGRKWAERTKEDAKSLKQIQEELELHYAAYPPKHERLQIIDSFVAELRQN